MVSLRDGEKNSKICLFVLAWSTNVTDRRTDGRTLHDSRDPGTVHRAVETYKAPYVTKMLFVGAGGWWQCSGRSDTLDDALGTYGYCTLWDGTSRPIADAGTRSWVPVSSAAAPFSLTSCWHSTWDRAFAPQLGRTRQARQRPSVCLWVVCGSMSVDCVPADRPGPDVRLTCTTWHWCCPATWCSSSSRHHAWLQVRDDPRIHVFVC